MGGMNHQPCGKYFPDSAKLSLELSRAQVRLHMANIALEELILGEFEGRQGGVEKISAHLMASSDFLRMARKASDDLRQRMDEYRFMDLPTLHKLDLEAVGQALVQQNMVRQDSWRKVVSIIKRGSFYAMLSHFNAMIESLVKKTGILSSKIDALSSAALEGEVGRVLEENRLGNIKIEFAELYTSWSDFISDFLASSMLSTELWYAFMGYGSLVQCGVRLAVV